MAETFSASDPRVAFALISSRAAPVKQSGRSVNAWQGCWASSTTVALAMPDIPALTEWLALLNAEDDDYFARMARRWCLFIRYGIHDDGVPRHVGISSFLEGVTPLEAVYLEGVAAHEQCDAVDLVRVLAAKGGFEDCIVVRNTRAVVHGSRALDVLNVHGSLSDTGDSFELETEPAVVGKPHVTSSPVLSVQLIDDEEVHVRDVLAARYELPRPQALDIFSDQAGMRADNRDALRTKRITSMTATHLLTKQNPKLLRMVDHYGIYSRMLVSRLNTPCAELRVIKDIYGDKLRHIVVVMWAQCGIAFRHKEAARIEALDDDPRLAAAIKDTVWKSPSTRLNVKDDEERIRLESLLHGRVPEDSQDLFVLLLATSVEVGMVDETRSALRLYGSMLADVPVDADTYHETLAAFMTRRDAGDYVMTIASSSSLEIAGNVLPVVIARGTQALATGKRVLSKTRVSFTDAKVWNLDDASTFLCKFEDCVHGTFALVSVVCASSDARSQLSHGHFWAYARRNNQWYFYDDTKPAQGYRRVKDAAAFQKDVEIRGRVAFYVRASAIPLYTHDDDLEPELQATLSEELPAFERRQKKKKAADTSKTSFVDLPPSDRELRSLRRAALKIE